MLYRNPPPVFFILPVRQWNKSQVSWDCQRETWSQALMGFSVAEASRLMSDIQKQCIYRKNTFLHTIAPLNPREPQSSLKSYCEAFCLILNPLGRTRNQTSFPFYRKCMQTISPSQILQTLGVCIMRALYARSCMDNNCKSRENATWWNINISQKATSTELQAHFTLFHTYSMKDFDETTFFSCWQLSPEVESQPKPCNEK